LFCFHSLDQLSIPEKRADWAAGVLQLVLGGAIGFALKRPS
jgi:hypothetical protein